MGDTVQLGFTALEDCLFDELGDAHLRCHYRDGELLYARPDDERYQGCWQDSLVSIPALDPLPELTIFPNPATTQLTLSGIDPLTSRLLTLTVSFLWLLLLAEPHRRLPARKGGPGGA